MLMNLCTKALSLYQQYDDEDDHVHPEKLEDQTHVDDTDFKSDVTIEADDSGSPEIYYNALPECSVELSVDQDQDIPSEHHTVKLCDLTELSHQEVSQSGNLNFEPEISDNRFNTTRINCFGPWYYTGLVFGTIISSFLLPSCSGELARYYGEKDFVDFKHFWIGTNSAVSSLPYDSCSHFCPESLATSDFQAPRYSSFRSEVSYSLSSVGNFTILPFGEDEANNHSLPLDSAGVTCTKGNVCKSSHSTVDEKTQMLSSDENLETDNLTYDHPAINTNNSCSANFIPYGQLQKASEKILGLSSDNFSTDGVKVLQANKVEMDISSLTYGCFVLWWSLFLIVPVNWPSVAVLIVFKSFRKLQNLYFLQLQAKYESFETTASWTARAAEIEPDCADSGEIQTQTDYLSSNSPSFAEEDSPNTGNPFKPPPASLFVHGANASEDADNDRTGKANGFCTPENDWHATPSLNAVKDFTDILAYMYTQEILSKLENPVSTANQDDFLPATRDESKEHFAHLEFEDWQNFSRKFEYSSDLDRPFQLPCYNSAFEGKAVGAPLAHDTDELQEILKELKSDYEYLRPPPTEILCYTIPRYPDNHNPLLPLALQKKLDEMAPREFLTYVLKELTLEERESLMVDERQRRKSFLVNWPHSNNLSGVKLAQAGFYCVGGFHNVWGTSVVYFSMFSLTFMIPSLS
ncbi:hypothetical protein EB796_018751 [Bugula neritina]|uniref:Transmembrane protein n=1 Tax=Bugula neritina TaxID=10212 RepID=A0A7J7JBC5_BUGNE|nr:hypothetical protein EB796_018751 [Bugula neritina]